MRLPLRCGARAHLPTRVQGKGRFRRALAAGLAACALWTAAPAVAQSSGTEALNAAASSPAPPDSTGYIDVEGVRLYFEVYGDPSSGVRPLLILHGAFMSSGEMAEFANGFKPARPVIVIDQRAHGRSTGVSAPLSYPQLGDDAAAVVTALGLERVDVIGYSMGGGAALNMAVRHPERIGKLVVLSATYRRDGWYPEVMETIGGLTAEVMANTPMRTEYQRLSPTPDSFVVYFERVKALNHAEFDMPEEQVRGIEAPTMVIIGDADGVRPEHAISLFKLRGGGDTNAAAMGMLTETPKARLMILPAAGHLGLLAMVPEIVAQVEAFLTDAKPRLPAAYGGGGL